MKDYHCQNFQNEIIEKAGEEAFELGLLMRTRDMSVDQEEDTDVFCFVHSTLLLFHSRAR